MKLLVLGGLLRPYNYLRQRDLESPPSGSVSQIVVFQSSLCWKLQGIDKSSLLADKSN